MFSPCFEGIFYVQKIILVAKAAIRLLKPIYQQCSSLTARGTPGSQTSNNTAPPYLSKSTMILHLYVFIWKKLSPPHNPPPK